MSLQPHLRDNAPSGEGGSFKRLLERTLGVVSAIILLILVMITCVDVVGRYFLNMPLNGAFEMTEVLLVALVFSALPLATERREHVEVDLLATIFSQNINRLLIAFGGLFTAAVLLTFSWRLTIHAMKAAEDGAVTNALEIPLASIGYFAAVACFISAIIAVLRGFKLPSEPESIVNKEEGAL
jgi:TRAP-type C4-dicarboxylate transport system permease small subunit